VLRGLAVWFGALVVVYERRGQARRGGWVGRVALVVIGIVAPAVTTLVFHGTVASSVVILQQRGVQAAGVSGAGCLHVTPADEVKAGGGGALVPLGAIKCGGGVHLTVLLPWFQTPPPEETKQCKDNARWSVSLSIPAVVEQQTEQDEHQQSHGTQDSEQKDGMVGGDVPQACGV
ncbi:hypothetical protein JZ751_026532, partial [Albula glossodonta]